MSYQTFKMSDPDLKSKFMTDRMPDLGLTKI